MCIDRSKYNFSSPHEDEMENNIHNHSAPPFLMSPGDKLFPPPGSFNFSMAALAADPQALASESETNLIPNLKFMT